ncbi:MAG: hypothetical protein EOO65_01705 [Methanosarcinales archaeon]|nr:MAG: hypothetical protein EOO65_01705 [Methanosarcinales archaeon]
MVDVDDELDGPADDDRVSAGAGAASCASSRTVATDATDMATAGAMASIGGGAVLQECSLRTCLSQTPLDTKQQQSLHAHSQMWSVPSTSRPTWR